MLAFYLQLPREGPTLSGPLDYLWLIVLAGIALIFLLARVPDWVWESWLFTVVAPKVGKTLGLIVGIVFLTVVVFAIVRGLDGMWFDASAIWKTLT